MSGQHARNSASSAYRWFVCAGSVGPGGETTLPAAQGTFAHDIAARCLKDPTLAPEDFYLKRDKIDGFDVECDQEMVQGVHVYLDAVNDDMQEGDMMWVEMPLLAALQKIDPDLGGTSDYVRYRPSTKNLLACDFKYGAGVYVEVLDNKQLKMYALGALLEILALGHKVETVTSMVVQPRYEGANPVRSETFKAVELLDFAIDAQEACARTRLPNPPLVAGDHCKFCPKARTCPELEKRHHALIQADLGAVIDVQQVAVLLKSVPLAKVRIKAIESYAYKLACQGVEIPEHKLVEKEGRRKWKSEGDVIMWAQQNAVDPYAPREVLSPAQLEEKIKATAPKGKKKEAVKVLEPFYHKVSSGTALVHVSDDRPAVKRVADSDFAAVTEAKPAAQQQSVINLF